MARPRWHILTTTPLAAVLWRRWGGPAALGAVAGGVLIDVDHLIDYAWTRAKGEKSHYLAPFHGWEVAVALTLFAGRSRAVAGLAAGVWLHLVVDVIGNRPKHPGVYSLLYRARHGFRREATGWTVEKGFHFWSELPWYRWWQAI